MGRRARLVRRRPICATRPSVLERQALRRHRAGDRGRGGGHGRRRRTRSCRSRSTTCIRSRRARRSGRRADRSGARRRSPTSCARRPSSASTAGRRSTSCCSASAPTRTSCRSFPGSAAFESPDLALAIPAPTHIAPRVPRVTLNPAVVGVARHVLVVAYGSDKAAAIGADPRPRIRPPAMASPDRAAPGCDLDPR